MEPQPCPLANTTTRCAACRHVFSHTHQITNNNGFYMIICSNFCCRISLLRCTTCDYNVVSRRRQNMLRHLSNHRRSVQQPRPDHIFDADASHSEFTLTSSPISTHPEPNISHDPNYTEVISPNLLLERPGIHTLLGESNKFDEAETQRDRDDDIIDTLLCNLSNTETHLQEFTEDSADVSSVTSKKTNPSHLTLADFDYMQGIRNRLFFIQQHNYPLHGGIRGVVHRADNRLKVERGDAPKSIDISKLATLEEADLLFDITDNLVERPFSEQQRYISSIRKLMKMYSSPPNCTVMIPSNRQTVDQMCLRSHFSIFNNVPCERTFQLEGDGHVMISLDDKLDLLFAKGTDFGFLQDHLGETNTDGFNGTNAAQDLYMRMKTGLQVGDGETTCFGHLMLWSDSFQKNHSRQTKDRSIWLLVARIAPPQGLLSSKDHTFCLAFGKSSLDHDRVIEYYLKEIQQKIRVGKYRYYGKPGVRQKVNTCFDIAVYIADTPERDAIIHRLHLGNYGVRCRHAVRIDSKKLPSCDCCFWLMVENSSSRHVCNSCCNWDHFTNSSAKYSDPTEGSKYPTQCSPNNPYKFPAHRTPNEHHLVCIEQSFSFLTQAARAAFYEHSEGTWKYRSTTKAYLSSCAIDAKVQHNVCEAAAKARAGQTVNDNDYIPALWQLGISMDIFVETTMHLLGHGVIASILELTESVLTEHKLWSSFTKFANVYLADIQSFRLDWCKIKLLPKANWLAEDEFGFGRLVLFLYSKFFEQNNIETAHEGTILSVALTELKRVLCSCHVLISLLMSKEKIDSRTLDRHIKIFLSCFHCFCKEYYDASVTEFWFTKANFLSLLNLPAQIQKFGPIGHYYDGVFESFLQGPKRALKSAKKSQVSMANKMTLMNRLISMESIRRELGDVNDDEDTEKQYQGVRIYPSKDDVIRRFKNGMCLSCFYGKRRQRDMFVPYSVWQVTLRCSSTEVCFDRGCEFLRTELLQI